MTTRIPRSAVQWCPIFDCSHQQGGSKISGWHTFKPTITALAVFGPTALQLVPTTMGFLTVIRKWPFVNGKLSPNFTIKKMDFFETFTVHRFVSQLWSPSHGTKVSWRWVPASLNCLLRFSTWNSSRVPKEMSKGKGKYFGLIGF
jgi:hypothetical protein